MALSHDIARPATTVKGKEGRKEERKSNRGVQVQHSILASADTDTVQVQYSTRTVP